MNDHPLFYFTFGVGHEYAGHYVEIVARNAEMAKSVMESAHGTRWSAYYTAAEFKGLELTYNWRKLATIRLRDCGCYHADHPHRFTIGAIANA